jgi:hypothetical protein
MEPLISVVGDPRTSRSEIQRLDLLAFGVKSWQCQQQEAEHGGNRDPPTTEKRAVGEPWMGES